MELAIKALGLDLDAEAAKKVFTRRYRRTTVEFKEAARLQASDNPPDISRDPMRGVIGHLAEIERARKEDNKIEGARYWINYCARRECHACYFPMECGQRAHENGCLAPWDRKVVKYLSGALEVVGCAGSVHPIIAAYKENEWGF